jgi:hypothetical protein
MIERTTADWDTLTREYGRMVGDVITYQRALADARKLIAELEEQIPRPPDDEGGSA